MTDVINTKQLEDIFSAVEGNTKDLVVASAANKRAPPWLTKHSVECFIPVRATTLRPRRA